MPGRRYRAFGRVVESDHPLAELHAVAPDGSRPAWRLMIVEGAPPEVPGATRIGTEEIAYGATVSLDLLRAGEYRLTYSDTGTFDLSAPTFDLSSPPDQASPPDMSPADM